MRQRAHNGSNQIHRPRKMCVWVCQDKDTKFAPMAANLGNTNTTSYNERARYQVVGNHSAQWRMRIGGIRINKVRISAERTIDAGNILLS